MATKLELLANQMSNTFQDLYNERDDWGGKLAAQSPSRHDLPCGYSAKTDLVQSATQQGPASKNLEFQRSPGLRRAKELQGHC